MARANLTMSHERHSRRPATSTAWLSAALLILASAGLGNVALAQTTTVNVSTPTELLNAVASANAAGGNRTIALADGTYTLTSSLNINAPNVSLISQSGAREKVIVQGDAMSSSAQMTTIVRVAASNFQLRGITLQRSRHHIIQIVGEANADSPNISNCVLRDAYQQLLKVTVNPGSPSITSDGGVVENCLFEYSAGIGPQYYIGGIDAHAAKNWTVRNNTFRSIISPSGSVAEFAVHFWNNSANNIVERNVIVNCDRGIGFGMDGQGNTGGVIRNNMIYHAASAGSYSDTGIALIESPGTQVYNNTVFFENAFPWAIEYRFTTTTNVLIANNLTNKPILARDGATGTLSKNVSNATAGWFVKPSSGDLHLSSAVAGVVDAGQTVSGLTNDFDGQPRTSAVDIGADEFGGSTTAPNPPTNLTVTGP